MWFRESVEKIFITILYIGFYLKFATAFYPTKIAFKNFRTVERQILDLQ